MPLSSPSSCRHAVLSAEDWAAIALTLRLAATTTVLLLVLCTPIAVAGHHLLPLARPGGSHRGPALVLPPR